MRFRRLLPDPAEIDGADQLTALALGARAREDRPWVVANFVMAADGRAAYRGESAPLGSDGDREVFHRLRTQVDAVLAGTGTVAAETYNRLARQPERRAQREADGLAADPWLIQVTRSGRVPWEAPLFRDAAQPVLVVSGAEVAPPPDVTAPVEVERVDETSFAAALAVARRRYGIASVLCEGGPRVLRALLAEGVVDELFLTLSPRLTGGGAEPGVTEGELLPDPAALALVWALERDGFLFLRYRVA